MSSEDLRRRAAKAEAKAASHGGDIELDEYDVMESGIEDLDIASLDSDVRSSMTNVGFIEDEDARSGSFILLDNRIVHRSRSIDGLEVMSTSEALEKYDWVRDLAWNAVPVDTDKYTAKTFLEGSDGYFIRVRPGVRIEDPIQAGQVLDSVKALQNVHNIVVIEEGASLQLISGCTSTSCAKDSLHLAASEIYVMDDASMTFTTIHNWSQDISARPRTVVKVGARGSFTDNYISLGEVKDIQLYPKVHLQGVDGLASFSSISIAPPGCRLDMGSQVSLEAEGCRAEIVSRSITTGGEVINRGRLIGAAPGIKAHLECNSLIMSDEGVSIAIPELEARLPDVEMTHEAAVGKVAQEQVEYLMIRGLSEEQAVGIIVRGFLEGGIVGLPEQLRAEVESAIERTNIGGI